MKGKTMVISSLDINVLDILIDRIEIILDKEIDFRWKWIKIILK